MDADGLWWVGKLNKLIILIELFVCSEPNLIKTWSKELSPEQLSLKFFSVMLAR